MPEEVDETMIEVLYLQNTAEWLTMRGESILSSLALKKVLKWIDKAPDNPLA